MPNFRDDPGIYDYLRISSFRMPGVWRCNDIGAGYKLKKPKGSGNDGGAIRATGLDVKDGTITSDLHTADEEEIWADMLKVLRPIDNTKKLNVQEVFNPQFARHGINWIVIEHASEQRPLAGGPLQVAIKFTVALNKKGETRTPSKVKPKPPAQGGTRPGNDLVKHVTTPAEQVKAAGGR